MEIELWEILPKQLVCYCKNGGTNMKITIGILLIVLICSSFSCDTLYTPRVLKPYDPEKAGATIIESFDITNDIIFTENTVYYDLFEYNGNIYIHIEGIIYFFDKDDFKKTNEVTVIFPDPGYSNSQYYELRGHGQPFYDPRNIGYYAQGFAVTGNKALLLTRNKFWSDQIFIFSIDLTNGDAVLLDVEDIQGIDTDDFNFECLIGYDKERELVWFRIVNKEVSRDSPYYHFYFFRYNENEQAFTFYEKKDAPYSVGRSNQSEYYGAVIHGNDIWYTGAAYNMNFGRSWDRGLDRRRLDDPFMSLHFIDVEYLGTLNVPFSIIYDPPYIWIMVEREEQIQVLKLLPNG